MENMIRMAIDLENHAAQLRKMAGQRVQTLADKLEEMGVDVRVYAATWLFCNKDRTQEELAAHLGICSKTITRWKKSGFDLMEHLSAGLSVAQEKIK